MRTRRELADYCLTFPGAYEDYPFGDDSWLAVRHRGNKKTFAFIYIRDGAVKLNLKCDPMRSDFLRTAFPQVTPAYHMNKTHWNTVEPGGSLPDEELHGMISHSFDLTRPKIAVKK